MQFKPRNSDARQLLKQLKDAFDNPSFDMPEKLIEWSVLHGPVRAMRAYAGEFLHRLALRSEQRGETQSAKRRYRLSLDHLRGNPMGRARTLRDYGIFVVLHGDTPESGVTMIEEALQEHDKDVDNEKGRRQRLITRSKLWRAQIILDDEGTDAAKQQLIELALNPLFDTFCDRDQMVIIGFLVTRTKGEVRRDLLRREAAIHFKRRQRIDMLKSCVRLVVDIELSAIDTIARLIFRRE